MKVFLQVLLKTIVCLVALVGISFIPATWLLYQTRHITLPLYHPGLIGAFKYHLRVLWLVPWPYYISIAIGIIAMIVILVKWKIKDPKHEKSKGKV
jgi:hypothetical protein